MAVQPFTFEDIEAALGGRFAIHSELALGGQAAVFKATRVLTRDGLPTKDVIALKMYLYRDQDIRVDRETAAMENISHPALARLIEYGHFDLANRHMRYIAWEFIGGETLSQRLKNGRLLESEVVGIGRDISAAIAELWSRHIVHGDIKPSNIMLKDSGGAVLIDLGAARHLEQDNSPDARKPFGTVGYFSPEQARGTKSLTCASDVFSLGVVMLQSLLGRHPTDYHQSALADGIRASGGKLTVSVGLLGKLDKMLSARSTFRPNPVELSSYFERLLRRTEAESDPVGRPALRKTGK